MTSEQTAQQIKAVILDIDGVLTDGRVGYSETEHEIKFFDVKDGHGIKLLIRAGLRVGLFSGRESKANRRRAEELGIHFIYQNEKNKREAFARLLNDQDLNAEECLYMGDDLVDIPVLRRAGMGVAVGDATADTKQAADWVTQANGGHGAVREVAEWLLKAQGKWDGLIQRYVGT